MINVKKILRNFAFLSVGKILGDVFTFLLFVVLSRVYGKEGVGQYSFAMAFTGFFAAFSDFGLYHFSVKEMSRHSESFGEYYGGILLLRLILSLIMFGLLLCILPFLRFSYETKTIIALIGAYQIFYRIAYGFVAKFCANEEMRVPAFLEFSLRVIIAITGILVIALGGSLIIVILLYPVVTLFQLVISYKLVTKKYGQVRLSGHWHSLIPTLRRAFPFGQASMLFILAARVDVVMLGFILGEVDVGLYNIAYRQIFVLTFIPHFVAISVFPMLSKLYLESKDEFKKIYHNLLNLNVLIGLPLSLGIWLTAQEIIIFIFGPTFVESVAVLRILMFLLFLGFLESTMATFLMASDKESDRAKGYWILACANILGNSLLIPIYGIKGAAFATLFSKALQVGFYAKKIHPELGWPKIGGRFCISSVATASFFIPFTLLPFRSLVIVIPGSVLIYFGTLMLFKDIRKNEFIIALDLIRGKLSF